MATNDHGSTINQDPPIKRSRSIVDLMLHDPEAKSRIEGRRNHLNHQEKVHAPVVPVTAEDHLPPISASNAIVDLDPKRIRPWAFADRPEEEYGDISELMASIQASGQIQPIIVRAVHNDSLFDFELIAGARRRRACELAKCSVKALISNVDDRAGFLLMREENDKRSGLSPWANAVAYKKAIEQGIYSSESDLARHTGVAQSTISELMSYFRIHPDLINAIGCFSKVSITTAKSLVSSVERDINALPLLINHAFDIRNGTFSSAKIKALLMTTNKNGDECHTYATASGREVMTFRKDSNGTPVISLLKGTRDIIDPEALAKDILALIEGYERRRLEEANHGITS